MQDLVLQSDALPAGRVTKWEWYGVGKEGKAGKYFKFRLTLCHTSRTALSERYADNYAGNTPAQVFYRDPLAFQPKLYDWFGFDFDAPFAYNGQGNLIVEVWWAGQENEATAFTDWGRDFLGRSVVSFVTHGVPECGYPDAGRVQDYVHYMRLTMTGVGVAPTSLGRVKALYR
jgi:hypothetical protein